MSTNLTKIDKNYSQDIDVNQLWGQAVALFNMGEPWVLTDS